MQFTKMQGAGNDFVVMESNGKEKIDWAATAVSICDRHFGVGADGLLLLCPSQKGDFRMRLFNADGSEAESCGNGIRCLVKYIVETGKVTAGTSQVTIETLGGTRRIGLQWNKENKLTRIRVGMGKPIFEPEKIPVSVQAEAVPVLDYPLKVDGETLKLSFVSMGNPHAVYFYDKSSDEFPLSRLGPLMEHHKIFPNRTNFEVAHVLSRRRIETCIWERGVGETLACGTGACAVAVAARLHGYTDNKVDIIVPGGTLNVEWDGAGEVYLSGPAEIVFTGEWKSKE